MKLFFTMMMALVVIGGGCVPEKDVEAIVLEPVNDPSGEIAVAVEILDNTVNSMVSVSQPLSGATVTSPLVVTGEARGMWYFEASFPVVLKDVTGATLATGIATAIGDWMTEDFVPFSVTLTFAPQPAGSVGTLTLVKDNPSGLPENDDYVDVSVLF